MQGINNGPFPDRFDPRVGQSSTQNLSYVLPPDRQFPTYYSAGMTMYPTGPPMNMINGGLPVYYVPDMTASASQPASEPAGEGTKKKKSPSLWALEQRR
jgi:hypothetical protein